jgi:hypothetical protein
VFPVRYEHYPSCSLKDRMMDNAQKCVSCAARFPSTWNYEMRAYWNCSSLKVDRSGT